jgi:hypothetical protein
VYNPGANLWQKVSLPLIFPASQMESFHDSWPGDSRLGEHTGADKGGRPQVCPQSPMWEQSPGPAQ